MKKIILIALAIILAACSAVPAGESELAQNQQKWETANISHYRFQLDLSCFCAFRDQMPLTVEVQDGNILSITSSDGTEISPADPNYEYFSSLATIDKLLAEIESASSRSEAGEIVVKYDETYGYPTEASIDYIKEAIDDELYVFVTGFEALP